MFGTIAESKTAPTCVVLERAAALTNLFVSSVETIDSPLPAAFVLSDSELDDDSVDCLGSED